MRNIWFVIFAVAGTVWMGSLAQAELNRGEYITTAGGGTGSLGSLGDGDGRILGDISGVGEVTLLDKDGNDMWNNGDDFTYLFDNERVQGDFRATVRVVSQTEAIDGRWGKNGIRASRDLSASSAFAMTQAAAGNGSQTGGANPIPIRMAGRRNHGNPINPGETGGMFETNIAGSPENTFDAGGTTPIWLRLDFEAATNTFSSFWAPDNGGSPGAWSDPVTETGVPVGDDGLYVGLAYSAHDDMNFDQVTRADGLHGITFDSYSLVPEPTSIALVGLGLLSVLGLRRRRTR